MIMNRIFIILELAFGLIPSYCEEPNYSREMKQAITLYQEGKNSDAMDRFMDIMVSGTPEEKAVANEYISKITNGVSGNASQSSSVNIKSVSNAPPQGDTNAIDTAKTNYENPADIVSKKVSDKIKQIKTDALVALYRKNFIKLYMNEANDKPLYILLKENIIFNENMTFNNKVIDDLKTLSGLLTSLGKVTITIIPNGAVIGNMKISNIRKASIMHSFFTSYGISPGKIKLDMVANNISVSKKIDDLEGILLMLNYDKEPDNVISDNDSPQASIAAFPDRIDVLKDEASIIEFSVIMGKNPIATWRLMLSRKEKDNRNYEVQKLEGAEPTSSQILFNGREKIIGNIYPSGEYEFSLEVSDVKGNNAFVKKTIYVKSDQNPVEKREGTNATGKQLLSKASTHQNLKKSKISKSNSKTTKQNIPRGVYKIYFEPNTFNITDNTKIRIEQMINDFKQSKKKKIILVGYASSKEKKPKTMALKRANTAKNYISKTFKISSKKILVYKKIVDINKFIVEASFK